MTTCSRPRCPKPPHHSGLCRGHYRKHLSAGLCGRVDATEVAEHIARLRALGWTGSLIGAAAGVSHVVPYYVSKGERRTLTRRTAAAILAIEPVLVDSPLLVDAVGTRRRIEALACLGWPQKVVALRIGRHYTMLTRALSRGRVTASTALLVANVYRELSRASGPSRLAATRARNAGWAPPAAWDDDEIDNPRARPRGVRRVA